MCPAYILYSIFNTTPYMEQSVGDYSRFWRLVGGGGGDIYFQPAALFFMFSAFK